MHFTPCKYTSIKNKKIIVTNLLFSYVILDVPLMMTKSYGKFEAIWCLFLIPLSHGLKEKMLHHDASSSKSLEVWKKNLSVSSVGYGSSGYLLSVSFYKKLLLILKMFPSAAIWLIWRNNFLANFLGGACFCNTNLLFLMNHYRVHRKGYSLKAQEKKQWKLILIVNGNVFLVLKSFPRQWL